jgi:hypothetical protein
LRPPADAPIPTTICGVAFGSADPA